MAVCDGDGSEEPFLKRAEQSRKGKRGGGYRSVNLPRGFAFLKTPTESYAGLRCMPPGARIPFSAAIVSVTRTYPILPQP